MKVKKTTLKIIFTQKLRNMMKKFLHKANAQKIFFTTLTTEKMQKLFKKNDSNKINDE